MSMKKLTKRQVASNLIKTYKLFETFCTAACEKILKDNDMWYCGDCNLDVCLDHNDNIIEYDRNGDQFVSDGLFPPLDSSYLKSRKDILKYKKSI